VILTDLFLQSRTNVRVFVRQLHWVLPLVVTGVVLGAKKNNPDKIGTVQQEVHVSTACISDSASCFCRRNTFMLVTNNQSKPFPFQA
jgi:hypothetical protein